MVISECVFDNVLMLYRRVPPTYLFCIFKLLLPYVKCLIDVNLYVFIVFWMSHLYCLDVFQMSTRFNSIAFVHFLAVVFTLFHVLHLLFSLLTLAVFSTFLWILHNFHKICVSQYVLNKFLMYLLQLYFIFISPWSVNRTFAFFQCCWMYF